MTWWTRAAVWTCAAVRVGSSLFDSIGSWCHTRSSVDMTVDLEARDILVGEC